MKTIIVIVLGLLVSTPAMSAGWEDLFPRDLEEVSTEVHTRCMEGFLGESELGETFTQALARKMWMTMDARVNVDVLGSIVLEVFHMACYRYAGETDLRDQMGQMPWVAPVDTICQETDI